MERIKFLDSSVQLFRKRMIQCSGDKFWAHGLEPDNTENSKLVQVNFPCILPV